MLTDDRSERARLALGTADRVLVLTGAGVSHASGVPTFRGGGGFWREHRPETLATAEAFERDPRLVWEWYGWRRELVAQCAPNAAHHALALATSRAVVTLVTQNVDGLHDLAADAVPARLDEAQPQQLQAPARPITLHGSLFALRCTVCDVRRADRTPIDASSLETLPHCRCGALMRPDVVWFGEALDPVGLDAAVTAATQADVCLVVGTSGVVYPAAGVVEVASRAGALVIEVNPEPTALTRLAAIHLSGDAAEVVPALLD